MRLKIVIIRVPYCLGDRVEHTCYSFLIVFKPDTCISVAGSETKPEYANDISRFVWKYASHAFRFLGVEGVASENGK